MQPTREKVNETGTLVSEWVHLGEIVVIPGLCAGRAGGLTLWGRPASLVKKAVERGYSFATEHGTTPRGL